MVDDFVDHRIVRNKGEDLHLAPLMEAMSTARLPHLGQTIGSTS